MTGFDDHKEVKEMIFEKKTLLLRNGKECILRPTAPEDSEEMIRYMKETAAESPFLLRYPDEVQYTVEDEQRILTQLMNDPHTVMMVAEVDGKIAGNCSVSGIGSKRKVRHRCSYAIALYDRFRGMGAGSAMTGYALELASIEFDAFPASIDSDSGCNRSHQNDNILITDHWLDVLSEKHLAVRINLRGYDINGFMAVI